MRKLLIILMIGCQTAYSQVDLNLGLVAHYPFNGNANDVSVNAINGTVVNATLTTDRDGNPNSAYYFNGTNAYIQLPYSNLYNFAPNDSFSISVWVLPDAGNSWPAQSVIVKSPPNADYTLSLWNYGTYVFNYKAMSGYANNNVVTGTTTMVTNTCWYNVVTTYKNGVWKLYVNGNLESQDLSQTKHILQDGISKIVFGKKGESNGDWYKGKMDEIRLYHRVLNQQEVDTIVGTCYTPCPQKNDFSISFSACTPNSVTFSTNSTGYNIIRWDFGDGNTSQGSATTTNTYSNAGNYLVTLITDYSTCSDTIKKTVSVGIQNDNTVISTNDTTICVGGTKQLHSNVGLNFCWSPTTDLSNPNIADPVATPTTTTTYHLTSFFVSPNLITNGNFSAGNTGFTSQYHYTPNNTTEGEYFVGVNPQAWYPAHYGCTDHTTGNGNMMMVNGSPAPDVEVWKTTVPVVANTNYAFSTWICSISVPNPAQLAFSINGNSIGNLITASLPPCNWVQFYTTWNSGSAVSATIAIINKNTIANGNDFALDDISFSGLSIKHDSVKITVDHPIVITNNNTTICEGNNVQLNTTGASAYSWTPATGLSNTNIPNPIATPLTTTQYWVTGTTVNGCIAKDSLIITVNPSPLVTKSNDTTICTSGSAQLFASGGVSYSWTPAASLSNASSPNPIATPSSTTWYFVTVTGANACAKMDSVKVTVRTASTFSINPSVNMCKNGSIQLNASGGDQYNWTGGSLNNPSIPNPIANPASTTTYSVAITDTLCHNTGNLSTTVMVLPLPLVKAQKSNDVDCALLQSQLTATGAFLYNWQPPSTLSNPSAPNPIATPFVTTQYVVTGTDLFGCINKDSVKVQVSGANAGGYFMPTAFTPDGDGKNDCYGTKYWGTITEIEFSIYNRWGTQIFYTRQPYACWDGTYLGKPQVPGVYVYVIRARTTCQPVVTRKGTFALIR